MIRPLVTLREPARLTEFFDSRREAEDRAGQLRGLRYSARVRGSADGSASVTIERGTRRSLSALRLYGGA